MKLFASAGLLAALLAAQAPLPARAGGVPVSYKVADTSPSKDVSIQSVTLDAVAGMSPAALVKVNAALKSATAQFAGEAKRCGAAAVKGRPWGYIRKFEKAVLSDKYLSVVFTKSTVCAGSPDEEKDARVFSLKSGEPVPAHALFKHMLPNANIATAYLTNKDRVRLDEATAETLIDDSKAVLKIDDRRCDFYLKTTSYTIWADGKHLIFHPEFNQPFSFCQQEYLIVPE